MTNSKIMKAIISGIVATAVMTLVGVTAPYMGFQR
jgi:hypothetical protein